jgi:predicted TPR repeat methyltransferase
MEDCKPMTKTPPGNDPAKDLVERAYSIRSEKEQRALYKDWAESYDDAMVGGLQYTSPKKCARLLAEHLTDRHSPVLDVGCGTGLAGLELARFGFSVIDGIDISRDMLEMARRREIYRDLMAADLLQHLPIADAVYGGAICTGTFTHAHVGAACLDELVRTFKPGAVFAFTVHRDVHEEMGFTAKLDELSHSDALQLLAHSRDTYYDSSDDPEGHFYAYRKL